MDLESGCSAPESVEDNGVIVPDNLENHSEEKVESNGNCHFDDDNDDKNLVKFEGVSAVNLSPGGSVGSSRRPVAKKGFGLKKWRRIPRREGSGEAPGANLDSSKKRGATSGVGNSPRRNNDALAVEVKQRSEGSVSSTNAMVNMIGGGGGMNGIYGDSGLMGGGPVFAAGTDSENSEDRSSKSSTAASAPRMRYEMPAVAGDGSGKSWMKNSGGKNSGISVLRSGGQQGKDRVETSKKARGDLVKIEKENSHSSMESDSRSSNLVSFMQGSNFVSGNRRQSGTSANYDGENSDEAQDGEQQLSEENQTGFSKHDAEFEDVSQEGLAVEEEKSENHGSSMERDDLAESIITLQSIQEALETELQKLTSVGKEDASIFDDSFPAECLDQFQPDENSASTSDLLNNEIINLKQNVNQWQTKFEEARVMLEVKEAKIIDLESTLHSSSKPTKKDSEENYRGMEKELEGLFRLKIEAEIEYLVISAIVQNLRIDLVDQLALVEEQKTLAIEQHEVLNKLEDTEKKASAIKRHVEELETRCEGLARKDEVSKLQSRVLRSCALFIIQVFLFFYVVLWLLKELFPPQWEKTVPT